MSSTSATQMVSQDEISSDAIALTIVTRHDSTIYTKFAQYFAASQLGASVGITDSSQISFFTPTTYSGFESALTNEIIGGSVAWGAPVQLFNQLSANSLLRSFDDSSLLNWIAANISDTIAGAEMKHTDTNGDMDWVASAITSFGFTVNNQTLQNRGLPFPTSWTDLASSEFYTTSSQPNVGMANAPDSSATTLIYQLILQKYGWEKGWEILYSMAGNGNIYGGSVETRASVTTGEVAAALTMDFYGVIAMNENPSTQYVIPEDGTTILPDPIAISASAGTFGQLDAARAFVKYVLSEEGQALYTDNRVNRLPVRQDAFSAASTLVSTDTYITTTNIDILSDLYSKTLNANSFVYNVSRNTLHEETMRFQFEASITNVHTSLRSTWGDMVTDLKSSTITQNRFDELMILYGSPVSTRLEAQSINSQIISDSTFRVNIMSTWESETSIQLNDVSSYLSSGNTIQFSTFTLNSGIQTSKNTRYYVNWYIQTSIPLDVAVTFNNSIIVEQEVNTGTWINVTLPRGLVNESVTITTSSIYETKTDTVRVYTDGDFIDITTIISNLEIEYTLESFELFWYLTISNTTDVEISSNGSLLYDTQVDQTGWVNYTLNGPFTLNSTLNIVLYANISSVNASSQISVRFIPDQVPLLHVSLNNNETGLIWIAEDSSPNNFEIYRNTTLVDSGSWLSRAEYTYLFETDLVGLYNYTVIVYDLYNNSNTASIQFKFADDVDSSPIDDTTNPSDDTTPSTSLTPTTPQNSDLSLAPFGSFLQIVSFLILPLFVRYGKRWKK